MSFSESLVPRPSRIMSRPVALGSSVPQWPTFFIWKWRRLFSPTWCEVGPAGLSTRSAPSNGSKGSMFMCWYVVVSGHAPRITRAACLNSEGLATRIRSPAEELAQGRERFEMIAQNLQGHEHRHREERTGDAPQPGPKHQRNEDNHRVQGQTSAENHRGDEIRFEGVQGQVNQGRDQRASDGVETQQSSQR